jgi:3-dehydroquinate dehydratase
MQFVSIVTVGQHLSNVLQRHRIRQINQCSKIGVGLSPGFAQTLSAASNPAPWSTK